MHGQSEEAIERTGSDSDTKAGWNLPRGAWRRRPKKGTAKISSPVLARLARVRGGRISPADFAAAASELAAKIAFARRRSTVPTASEVAEAETRLRGALTKSSTSVMGGEPIETMQEIKGKLLANQKAKTSSGAFWDHVKSVLSSSAPILKSAIPGALVAAPVAALTASAVAKQAGRKAGQQAAEAAKPAAAPGAPTVEPTPGQEAKPDVQHVSGEEAPAVVPNDVYRAEIYRRACLLCPGKQPTAACIAKAQASVHAEMKKAGVRVALPGAAPGRVTR
jgi:hypothetical protein